MSSSYGERTIDGLVIYGKTRRLARPSHRGETSVSLTSSTLPVTEFCLQTQQISFARLGHRTHMGGFHGRSHDVYVNRESARWKRANEEKLNYKHSINLLNALLRSRHQSLVCVTFYFWTFASVVESRSDGRHDKYAFLHFTSTRNERVEWRMRFVGSCRDQSANEATAQFTNSSGFSLSYSEMLIFLHG